MSNNSDMVRMLRLVEGQQFAGEPQQKPGDQVRGTDKAVSRGKQHPFHNRLVGEELSLEDKLSKKYQDMKDLHRNRYGDYSKGATNPDGTASAQRQADRYTDRLEYERTQKAEKGVEEDAPAIAKMAGGLGLGLVAAAGAPAIVGILGPLLGIPLAAYGAYSAAKMGMSGVEKLWDMATEKLGSSDKVEQYTTAQIAKLPPEKAQAATAAIKQVTESRKGVAEGTSPGYTVNVRGNNFSYSRLKDALSDGHPSAAKIYKNGKLLGTIGSLGQQGVAEGSSEIKIPTEDGITMQDIRLMAGEGKLTRKTVLQAIDIIRKQRTEQGVAEGSLNEFSPGSGGGESGRWYTDDQITDLVGDGWYQDLDVSGDIPKQQMIQQAQAWLDDQGYSVEVLNCRVNDDDMEWYIEGTFYNPQFAKKGVAEADSPAQLDEFLPALAAGAGALARGAAAAGGAAIKGAQAVGGAIKQGVQSLAPSVASGAQAAGRAISKVPAAAEKKVIQGAEVLNALVPGGIFNPDGSVKGSQYLTKYLTPQQIQQAQQQGVTEGSGPKEKQKTPYRDINGPGYRAAADKQLTKMSKDKAAEPGKKLADKIKQKNVSEGYDDHNPVVSAISRRVMHQRLDLLQKYGVTKVMSAIDEVADFVGDVEEIGTSDVSGWVRHVERALGNMGELAETDVPPVAGAVPGAVPPAGTAPTTTATGAAPAQNPADIMKQKNDQRKAVQDQIASTTKQLADLRTQLSSIQ